MALDSDPYAVLGVPRDATDSQIAQARLRLSRKYHPDVNAAPDAAARFDEVQQAFNVLRDPAARSDYDRTGGHQGTATAPWEHRAAAEAAPGISVEPATVDFGLLPAKLPGLFASSRPGVPRPNGIIAAVAVSWTGAPPGRIRTSQPEGAWWTILRTERPDSSSVVFFLSAQVDAGLPAGPQRDKLTVTLDNTPVTIQLTAKIPDLPATRSAFVSGTVWGTPALWLLGVAGLLVLWLFIVVTGGLH
jgi:hypothetical protein